MPRKNRITAVSLRSVGIVTGCGLVIHVVLDVAQVVTSSESVIGEVNCASLCASGCDHRGEEIRRACNMLLPFSIEGALAGERIFADAFSEKTFTIVVSLGKVKGIRKC